MKIGILSDIHAQYDSLSKALTIFADEQVDKIICAGDIVEKGHDGDRVIRTLIQHKIPCVRGNHDEAALSNQRWLRDALDSDYVADIIPRLNRGEIIETQLLSDRAIIYLQALPFKLEFHWEGVHVLLVHGSPQSNSQYLMPAIPDDMLKSFLADTDADIIICGHTHSPMYRPLEEKLLLNSGSVCESPYNRESHTCAILTLSEKQFDVISLETGEKTSFYQSS